MKPDMRTFSSVDEVLDFAIAREVEAGDLYIKLEASAKDPTMRKVFEKFALEEQEHKRKLEAVKAGKVDIGNDEIGSLGIAEGVQDIEPRPDMSYVQFLEFAMKKEKTSFKLYNDLATMTKKQELRDIFLKLAQEEAEHKLRFEIEYDLRTF